MNPTKTKSEQTKTSTLPFQTPTHTSTPSPVPSKAIPQIFSFYGDSSLAIREVGDGKDHVGYSFVNNLKDVLDPSITLITLNYGGRTAKWANENIEEKLLFTNPDVVTLYYATKFAPVYLVDVWQLYDEYKGADSMYLDIVDPGSVVANCSPKHGSSLSILL